MKRTEVSNDDDDSDAPIKKVREVIAATSKQLEDTTSQMVEILFSRDKAIGELLDLIRAKEDAIKADREAFELSTQRVNDSVVPTRVKLDVGGRLYSVTPEMMQRFPNSYFGCLFSGRWEGKKIEDGAYFIDRSPRLFDYVADLLRYGTITATLSKEDHDALEIELDYYQLRDAIPEKKKETWEWKGGLKQCPDDKAITFSRGIVGWSEGKHEWTLCIVDRNDVRVGIMCETGDPDKGHHSGYKLDCSTGHVWTPTEASYKGYGRRMQVGEHVSVRLDMDKHELTFGVNGKWFGTLTHIPHKTWYPCVGLSKKSLIRLIE